MSPGEADSLLSPTQIEALRDLYIGRLVVVCFGAGVDSTAMLVALRVAGIRPDVITFADTGGEKPETLAHVNVMNRVVMAWGWPAIDVCRKVPMAATGYLDLYGNCIKNETLPSLAFGMKSCSIKWKQGPQDQFLKGAMRGPNARPPHPLWERSRHDGHRILKLIGYDCGRADVRRSKSLKPADADFDYSYPLQVIGWARPDCVHAITSMLGANLVPVKSACFFCPASKHWELYWLAAHHPALLELALELERAALTGRHSRFDAVEFGASWDDIVRGADRFPSTTTTVGLGRSFAWNQWARVNNVTNDEFIVHRSPEAVARFVLMSQSLRSPDNAYDARGGKVVQIHKAKQLELSW